MNIKLYKNPTVTVFQWGEDGFIDWTWKIDTNNIIECADWIKRFSGNHRLPNDVNHPLERAVIGAYQIGYLFDYLKVTDKGARRSYYEEGIASILLHTIASYEMMDREYIGIDFDKGFELAGYKWNTVCKQIYCADWLKYNQLFDDIYHKLAEGMFKYQRWILYNHMHRTKRWNEKEFTRSILMITKSCLRLCNLEQCDLGNGFALCMEKLQDQEIKRH